VIAACQALLSIVKGWARAEANVSDRRGSRVARGGAGKTGLELGVAGAGLEEIVESRA
jgi:hypothetical protein